jgi:Flp pilus assembly protein TadG
MMLIQPSKKQQRAGVAAMEMAVLAPFLLFMLLITIDFSRVFYYTSVCAFCARDGALYGCIDSVHAQDTTGIQNAALADKSLVNLGVTNVTSTYGASDTYGNPYVTVTVTYNFTPVTSFPGIPASVAVSRSETSRVSQVLPSGSAFN